MSVKLFGPNRVTVACAPNAPRLITLTTRLQRFTLAEMPWDLGREGIRHERWTYDRLFKKRSLPRAAYVFSDFDRMHAWQLEVASRFRERLLESGLTALNDPRRFVPRVELLRKLHRKGINTFECWLPAAGEFPTRFPVFLRTIHAHRGVESDLLHSKTEAEAALAKALERGRIISDLVFIEYCAEPDPESGTFRKHACYGINGEMIRALTVSDTNWMAKFGTVGAATETHYKQDLAEQQSYPHEDMMKRVFELAGLEFGRVDFGLVNGQVQVYEVNSNPKIRWTKKHPSKTRLETDRLVRDAVVQALSSLDYPEGRVRVKVSDLLPRWGNKAAGLGQP